MKKIRLFSTKAIKGIEGSEAELYVNFYLVLNKNYIFMYRSFSSVKRNLHRNDDRIAGNTRKCSCY